jgi:hypothetical protein
MILQYIGPGHDLIAIGKIPIGQNMASDDSGGFSAMPPQMGAGGGGHSEL